ncbi:MAG: hypothetical protein WC586_00740 [Methanoregula sp.]
MATIEDYGSGRILRSIRLAHLALRFTALPLAGKYIRRNLEERMEPFGIRPITFAEAGRIIHQSGHCAVGPRTCRSLFLESGNTESVFLDELADRMVDAGKAVVVTADLAIEAIKKYPDNPLVLSKVSGRYLEICRSVPEVCIYWKMKRAGLDV